MNVLLVTQIVAVAQSALLVIISTLLYVNNRESYLRDWVFNWIFTFFGLSCLLGMAFDKSFFILYMVLLSFSNYFLLRASHQVFGIIMPRLWKYMTLITLK
ncbi:MAG: hypothetical protein GX625_09120 [Clostridiaceae bacterium]|nr:hypothetical protein [Clostridiaceae bacterium]